MIAIVPLLNCLLAVTIGATAPSVEPTTGFLPSAPVTAVQQSSDENAAGIRFENVSREIQYVLVTFDGEQCGEMKQRVQLELAPGAAETVDTGSSRACWCASTSGKVGNCAAWNKAKPGKKVPLR